MEEKAMQVTPEMYSKLFNAITDANERLLEARKYINRAEVILSHAQAVAEEMCIED